MSDINNSTQIGADWIKIENGKFTCNECGNNSIPLTNTLDGMAEANLGEIKNDLANFPTKIIYGVCPLCGMEYIFKLHDNELFLEPSDEEK